MLIRRRGQSLLEYSILTIVLLGAFIATQNYIKRGIQGRWKSSVDELGDQYDPRTTNSLITSFMNGTANTIINVEHTGAERYTSRTDTSSITENKIGNTIVGSL
jgi:hypothetical protein